MLGRLKISAAAFICAAFVFRLLFINVDIISSIDSAKNNISSKKSLCTKFENNKHLDQLDNSKNLGFFEGEVLEEEEDSDDEGQFKLLSFLFIQSFYSTIEYGLNNTLNKGTISHNLLSYSTSPRYITLQVFRI